MNSFKDQQVRLQWDIDILKAGVIQTIPNVKSIFLCGGYGRDEGAWVFRENGEVEPYNDYDLMVVTDAIVSYDDLNKLRINLAKQIGIRWIDIDLKSKYAISKLKCTIKNYDLVMGSKCIYGDPSVFEQCSALDSRKIGFYDIQLLYFTRLWTFLGSFEGDFLISSNDNSMFFCNQMAKAVLAICDTILIKHHCYHISYCERVRRAQNIYSHDDQFVKLTNWAINEKLRPTITTISRDRAIGLYKQVYALFCKTIYTNMGWRRVFFKYPGLCNCYYVLSPSHLARILYYSVVKKSNSYKKIIDSNIAQNYVFVAYDNGNINPKYVLKAGKILLKYKQIELSGDWNSVRMFAAQFRNEV